MTIEQSVLSARKAGFTGDPLVNIIVISTRESDNNADATNDTRRFTEHTQAGTWRDPRNGDELPAGISPEYSVGPLQINLVAHPDISESAARDFDQAFAYAWTLSEQGRSFAPWSTSEGITEEMWRAAALAIAAVPESVDIAHSDPGAVELDEAQATVALQAALRLVAGGAPAYVEHGPENGQITVSVTAGRDAVIAAWPALGDVLPL